MTERLTLVGDVTEIGCITTNDIPAQKVLQGALESQPDEVAVVALKDGVFSLFVSNADMLHNLGYLRMGQKMIEDDIG